MNADSDEILQSLEYEEDLKFFQTIKIFSIRPFKVEIGFTSVQIKKCVMKCYPFDDYVAHIISDFAETRCCNKNEFSIENVFDYKCEYIIYRSCWVNFPPPTIALKGPLQKKYFL